MDDPYFFLFLLKEMKCCALRVLHYNNMQCKLNISFELKGHYAYLAFLISKAKLIKNINLYW